MEDKTRLTLEVDRSAEKELAERADRMIPRGPPLRLDAVTRSIQFLRGVDSRASFALPSFYLFIASSFDASDCSIIEGHPGEVFKNYIHHTSLDSIALACRKVFDHTSRRGFTGAGFAKSTDKVLTKHAEYWAKTSEQSAKDAYQALCLLRSFFRVCSQSNRDLLRQESTLGRRIGLIKQYADRSAAHLSLDDYAVGTLDLAHVVAALGLVGEIVRSFDQPWASSTYYNEVDEAAYAAAKVLFQDAPGLRLFGTMQVENQAKFCWQWGEEQALHMLLEQLPYAIGYF